MTRYWCLCLTVIVALAALSPSATGQLLKKRRKGGSPPRPPELNFPYENKLMGVRWEWDKDERRWKRLMMSIVSPNAAGQRWYSERHLIVMNDTQEPLQVHVQYSYLDRGKERWIPQDPKDGTDSIVTWVDPDRVAYVKHKGRPIIAVRARIWAISRSGKKWEDDRREDVWLVEERTRDNRRQYQAAALETFPYWIPKQLPELPPEKK